MAKTSSLLAVCIGLLVALALAGCIKVDAPESVDVGWGGGRTYVGDDPDATKDEVRAENRQLRRELDKTRSDLKKSRGKVDDLEEDLEKCKEQLDKIESERDRLKKQVKELDKANDRLRKENRELRRAAGKRPRYDDEDDDD